MRRTLPTGLAIVCIVALLAGGWLLSRRHNSPAVVALAPSPVRKALADSGGLTPKAVPSLKKIVESGKTSKDPKVQDEVGSARIRLAYIAAQEGKPQEARSVLLSASKEYKGTGAMSADFGGIADQAAYQAAVCLVMQKKDQEARSEFVRFIEERPESPLVHACYKRLVRMNDGKSTAEYDRLLQSATAQEKRIRFETSVCGPTDRGTSVAGMRRGLATLGVQSFAYKLSRKDLAKAPSPAILLEGDHYVALLSVSSDSATVYDTRFRSERQVKLPPLDDPDFSVNAILFSRPEIHP